MTDSQDLIVDRVNATADRLEGYDSPDDIDYLDAKVSAGFDGELREITVILGTGGPHIEVDLYSGTVRGHWGTATHTAPVDSPAVKSLADRLEIRWESVAN